MARRTPARMGRPLTRLEDRTNPASGDLDPSFNGVGFNVNNFSDNDDDFFAVTVDAANRTIGVGEASKDILIARYREDGTLDPLFGGGDGFLTVTLGTGLEEARGVFARPDGSLLVGASGFDFSDDDFALIEVSQTGTVVQINRRNVLGADANDQANGLAVNPVTGDAYVIGTSQNDIAVVHFGPDGGYVNEAVINISGKDDAWAAAVDPTTGQLFVGASADDQTTFAVLRFDADLGNPIQNTFNLGDGDETCKAVLVDPARNRVFFGGTSKMAGKMSQDFTLVATDRGLNKAGSFAFDMGSSDDGTDRIRGIVMDSAGRLVVAGRIDAPNGNNNAGVARLNFASNDTFSLDPSFDGDGKKAYDFNGAFQDEDRAYGLALAPDGRIVFAGQSGKDPLVARVLPDDDPPMTPPPSVAPVVIGPADLVALQFIPQIGPLAVQVTDADDPPAVLVLSATTDNKALFPAGSITFGGAGKDRTITLVPATGVLGTATVTLTVLDPDGLTDTDTFVVQVRANSLPVVSMIPDQTTQLNTSTPPILFTVNDFETPAAQLTLSGSSSTTLVGPGGFVFGGNGSARTVIITPAANVFGSAVITISATDANGGVGSRSFTLTVPTNNPPTISDVTDFTTALPGTFGPFAFTVGDVETAADLLTVTALSNNTDVVPTAGLVLGGSGANRTLTLNLPDTSTAIGTATVTLTVQDGNGLTAVDTFTVTRSTNVPPTFPPTISKVADLTVPRNGSSGPLTFTIGDPDTPLSQLQVSVVSSNLTLVPTTGLLLSGTGADRAVTVVPAANQSGTAVVTLMVTDGGRTAVDTFTVTVPDPPGVNTAPTITGLAANVEVPPERTLTFQIADAQTPADQLTVAVNPSIALTLVLGGTGANRTLTVNSASLAGGSIPVTVTVTDPQGLSASATVTVEVPPATPGAGTQFAVGMDAGGGAATLFDDELNERFTITPISGFTGGVRVAVADFDRDGVRDLVVGTGPGQATRVFVYDGVTQQVLFEVSPFESAFTGGVYVATGDLDGDGTPDLVITPDEGGGPRVDVYSGARFFSIASPTNSSFARFASFFGIDDPNFRGGARASTGDLNNDGRADLVVVAGFGGGPRVAAFDGTSVGSGGPVKLFGDFFAFEQSLRNGVFVTVGDLDGDGFGELIAGGGPGGGPRVTAFDGKALLTNVQTVRANFFGGDTNSRGGIRLTVADLDGDARDDLIVGAGAGAGDRVTAYAGIDIGPAGTPAVAFDFSAFDGFGGGVFVG